MIYVLVIHLATWWLIENDIWLEYLIMYLFDFLGASGLLLISGVTVTLSYKNRRLLAETSPNYNNKMLNQEYFLRALFFLIVALAFNTVYSWWYRNKIENLWIWNMLLTVAISLFLAWPLLNYSKFLRIFVSVAVWILNYMLLPFLQTYENQLNFYGILFYILYHRPIDDIILGYFTFFLIGTVFGDILFEIMQINDKEMKKSNIKKKLLYPSLIIGPILIIIGIIFEFPKFFINRGSLSWAIYCLGIDIIIFATFISIETFEIFHPKKSYKFLYYFSYYSLTIFVLHYPLSFLFRRQINLINIWFFIAGTIITIGLLLRFLYKRIELKYSIFNWKITFSLKFQISRMSKNLVRKKTIIT